MKLTKFITHVLGRCTHIVLVNSKDVIPKDLALYDRFICMWEKASSTLILDRSLLDRRNIHSRIKEDIARENEGVEEKLFSTWQLCTDVNCACLQSSVLMQIKLFEKLSDVYCTRFLLNWAKAPSLITIASDKESESSDSEGEMGSIASDKESESSDSEDEMGSIASESSEYVPSKKTTVTSTLIAPTSLIKVTNNSPSMDMSTLSEEMLYQFLNKTNEELYRRIQVQKDKLACVLEQNQSLRCHSGEAHNMITELKQQNNLLSDSLLQTGERLEIVETENHSLVTKTTALEKQNQVLILDAREEEDRINTWISSRKRLRTE